MPLEVFYSYSHKDEDLRNELEIHLSILRRNGFIANWHDRQIAGGSEWAKQIDEHIHSADIILLLISPDFLASDYCYDIEMDAALSRHGAADTIVIPIILRPCDWAASRFAYLQALPRDAKAITLWPNRDQAFEAVAHEIREIAARFQAPKPSTFAIHDRLVDQATPKPRVLDAAMPSHIVNNRATELLVLVRLPESSGLAGILQVDDEAEAKPEDVRSKPFEVTFPLGPLGRPEPLKITVELECPDFSPPSQRKNIFVPVNHDSEICAFLLTPLRAGPLLVVVELFWQDAAQGYRRLKTNCVAHAELTPPIPQMAVVQLPVGVVQQQEAMSGRKTGFEMAPALSLPFGSPPRPTAIPVPPPYPTIHQPPAGINFAKKTFNSGSFLKASVFLIGVITAGSVFLTQHSSSPPLQYSPADLEVHGRKESARPGSRSPASTTNENVHAVSPRLGTLVWEGEVHGSLLIVFRNGAPSFGRIASGSLPKGVSFYFQPIGIKAAAIVNQPKGRSDFETFSLRVEGNGLVVVPLNWSAK